MCDFCNSNKIIEICEAHSSSKKKAQVLSLEIKCGNNNIPCNSFVIDCVELNRESIFHFVYCPICGKRIS